MNLDRSLQQPAAATLQRWHRMIQARDLGQLPELLHPHAVFRSPMAFKPYEGATAVNLILNTVLTVFEDFAYHRELASADGSNVVLVRPMSGLQALGEEMGRRLAPQLAALKS